MLERGPAAVLPRRSSALSYTPAQLLCDSSAPLTASLKHHTPSQFAPRLAEPALCQPSSGQDRFYPPGLQAASGEFKKSYGFLNLHFSQLVYLASEAALRLLLPTQLWGVRDVQNKCIKMHKNRIVIP